MTNQCDPYGLVEKYLHSQGAALYEKGRIDEAIGCFRKAIDLADQPFTHYHLGLAYYKKGDLKKALEEIGRAIALSPFNPQYYYERSVIRRRAGDWSGSLNDRARAYELDPHYGRIREILAAGKAIDRFLESDAKMLAWCRKRKPEYREVARALKNRERCCGTTMEALSSASCVLPCPAYCCYFSGETVLHGVHIGPWKLMAIRNFIREKGIAEKDVLRRIPFKGGQLSRLIPPQFVIKENGRERVYFPRRSRHRLTLPLLEDLPKGKGYHEIAWINKQARACTFLQEGRCLIHDVGGEPSLPACKEFLCFTGFVAVLLRYNGLVRPGQLQTRNMADLNRLAVKALLILAREIYANQDITRIWASLNKTLKAAVKADAYGNRREASRRVISYDALRKRYNRVWKTQRRRAEKQICVLFDKDEQRAVEC